MEKEKSDLSKEKYNLKIDDSSEEDDFKEKKIKDKKNQSKEKKKYLDKTKMALKKIQK